ncbi:mCG6709, isoform CRA_a [Mus musculus]|nr:mCG6709, isoform CRA_a [Mus musculus]
MAGAPLAGKSRSCGRLLGPGQKGTGWLLLSGSDKGCSRASKEKEITVHFWNGKTTKVPLGSVRWVPPTVWKKAVERLQAPHTRDCHSSCLWVPHCSQLGPRAGCTTHRHPLDSSFLCPPCLSCACCQLQCQSSCPLVGPSWWPLTRTSELTTRKLPEPEVKPTAQLLPLQGPKEEPVAELSYNMFSSSSSSSEEENSESHLEMGLPLRQMVSRAVNTDPILSETTSLQQYSPHKPEWRYWRRNGPEPPPGKPGIRCHNKIPRS